MAITMGDSLNAKPPPLGRVAIKSITVVSIVNKTRSACAEGPITLIIGPDHEKRYIHKALLVHHSEYFRKALSGPWKEAEEGIVRLEDVSSLQVRFQSLAYEAQRLLRDA